MQDIPPNDSQRRISGEPLRQKPGAPAIVALLLGMACMLPLVYLCFFTHPAVDDFQNARWTSFWGVQKYYYMNWCGRYFSTVILTLDPIHWGIGAASIGVYQWTIVLLIIAFTGSVTAFLYHALRRFTDASLNTRIVLTVFTFLVAVNNFYSLSEAFYWYAGSMTYALSAVFVCLLLLLFMRLDETGSVKPVSYAAAMALLFGAIGSNETIMALCDLAIAALFIMYWRKGQRSLVKFYFIIGVFALVCTAMVVLAPGNTIRQQANNRDLLKALDAWLYTGKEVFLKWVKGPWLVLYSIAVLSFPIQLRLKPALRHPALALLLPLVLLYMLALPGFWALGDFPPSRTLNMMYLFFVPAWLFFLLALSTALRKAFRSAPTARYHGRQVVMVVFIFTALVVFSKDALDQSTFKKALGNIRRGIPQQYDRELNQRYAIIKAAPDTDTIIVPPLTHTFDNVLFFSDISTEPGTWPNPDYAASWNKKAIAVRPDTVGKPAGSHQ